MRKKLILTALLVLPLGIAAGVFAGAGKAQPQKDGYTCPLTGEQLPCKNCCPLNDKK